MFLDIYFHAVAIIYLASLLLIVYFKSNKKINITFYIVGVYLASVIGGLFLDSTLAVPQNSYSLWATFLFLLLITLFFVPLILSKTESIKHVQCPNYKLFDAVCYVFILIGIAAYLYFPTVIYTMLVSLETLNVRGADTGLEGNTLYLFITLGCQFFPIVLLFYFHSVCYRPGRVWFNRLLLFSSTAYIINVLTVMGRDGFVLWAMSYIFAFILYKNILPSQVKAKTKKTFTILLSFFLVIFFLISISRFYDDDGGVYFLFQKLLLYFSQQFGEFNRFVNVVQRSYVDVGSIFPIVDLFGVPKERKSFLAAHYSFISQYGFSQNVFKTFLGDFYNNLGLLITFFVSCLFAFLFSIQFLVGSTSNVKFGKLIMLTVFSQIILHGVFYFKLSYMVSNIYVFLCIALSVLFSFKVTFRTSS